MLAYSYRHYKEINQHGMLTSTRATCIMRNMNADEFKILVKTTYFRYDPAPLVVARKKARLNQAKMGEKLGFCEGTINRLETGKNADFDTVMRCCEVLNVPVDTVILSEISAPAPRGPRKKNLLPLLLNELKTERES